MIYPFVKNVFLFTISLFVYFNLCNSKRTVRIFAKMLLLGILLAALSSIISIKLSTIYFPLILPFYFVAIFLFSYREFRFSFSYAIVSVGISYTLYSILIIPTTLIFAIVISHSVTLYISYITFIVGILTILVLYLLITNRRTIKALHLFCNYNNFYTYVFFIFCFLLIVVTAQAKIQANGNSKIYSIGLTLIDLILLYVIQRQTQKYYLSKLKKLELESLRQELAEKDALIQKLQESNDHLARIIHKDNKLIPSMVSAVSRYLRNVNTLDADALRASGMTLARELEQMAQNRQGILSENEHQTDGIPHSGHAAVDAILLHMQNRAAALHIDYTVTLGAEFSDIVNRTITESDLTHLLADLIENALNATKESGTRCVLVHLGILYDAPVVEVSDSGRPFDPAVYQDFGLQKHSTHLNDGGSGIGLMDIWELKKKYAASLHIHEYEPGAASYTKRISVVFDRRNHYLIRTYRPQELLQYRIRTDMFILPLE